jgi:hypothetical protein
MRLRSRGLGRKELVLDFREYEVVHVDDEAVVVGTIRDPVNWDFTIRICEDDVPGMIRLVLRPSMLGLEAAGEKAAERARISLQPLATRRSATVGRKTAPERTEAAQPARGARRSTADAG